MLTEAVATGNPVATSRAGANMTAGLVAALAGAPDGAVGVLEVDEAHLPATIDAVAPVVIVLLNLSRDQLDRVSEVRLIAERWRAALARSDAVVIANADDPLVVYATSDAHDVFYVGVGSHWHEDAHHCPRCNSRVDYEPGSGSSPSAGWSCVCGFARPVLDAWITDHGLSFADRDGVALEPGLPGRFNVANAAMATIAATVLGIPLKVGSVATSLVTEVEGRFSTIEINGHTTRLLLAKNPAGFTELLELVRHSPSTVVIGINSKIADGHDPSWLWDVPFELLAGDRVIATGERALDLAVRLVHAGVETVRQVDQRRAIASAAEGGVDYIGNYTAFQELRRVGHRRATKSDGTTLTRHLVPVSRASMPDASKLRIVIVHPDLLGTYGDGGNGRVLANRARWRGIPVELIDATADSPLPERADVYLLGGGEDGPQLASADALRTGSLARAIDRGAVVLGVCAGYQILGHAFPAPDGSLHRGLGLLDVTTARGAPRAVGETLVIREAIGPDRTLTGFENHGGRTTRGEGTSPLGRVIAGTGNGDGTDGAVSGRTIGTYLHGPVLARNPGLADELLSLAVGAPLPP
ncbi:MAG TPA: MurT ligase domain-containing protein, partial [Acidimicrobiales bacterium]|nr:MurT ligase domain-containing protein [Acidimicrobiales bacterium]